MRRRCRGLVLRHAAALVLAGAPALMYAAPGIPDVRTLPNGLRVVLLEDHAVPLVAVSLWVHAGSKDEIETSSGYAHFLEHLVQRGTDTSGSFEYQKKAQRWGGSLLVRSNYDRTYLTLTGVPAVLGELVEAASGLAFRAALKDSEIDQELGTFNQEIHSYYDLPASVAFLETMRAAFPEHPYRFPILGNLRTLGTLKHDPLQGFYRNLYVPNNMALVIAGDFDPARAAALVGTAFGPAPKSGTLAPKPPPPLLITGHADVEKRLNLREAWTSLAFAGPGYRSTDRPAMEVLARALGDSGGGPLRKALLRERAGNAAQVTFYGLEDAGVLYAALTPETPELSYKAARAALSEIISFKARGLREPELRPLVARIIREERLKSEVLAARAESLGEAALFGGVRYQWDLPLIYARITPEDVGRVAARYLVPENLRLVVILPKETAPIPESAKEEFHAVLERLGGPASSSVTPPPAAAAADQPIWSGDEAWRVTPGAWGDPRDAQGLKRPGRTVLDNGLTLLTQEDHRNALVGISLFLKFGSGDDPAGREGAASLTGRLLAEAAATRRRAAAAPPPGDPPLPLPDIEVSRDLVELRLLTSPASLRDGLALLAAAARRPAPETAPLEAARGSALAALERPDQDPGILASNLFHEKVFAGHPYAHPTLGTATGLKALTTSDVAAFIARHLRPEAAVLAIAGDAPAGEAAKMVRSLFGDWRSTRDSPGPAEQESPPAILPAAGEFSRTLDSAQSRVLIGVPGAALGSPDFEPLRLLGTGLMLWFFEDTVFARRAAFGASAVPEGLREAGSLAVDVAAAPPRRDEAVFDLQRQMRRVALEPLPAGEIASLQQVQAGRDAARLQGAQALASTLGYREAIGIGADRYREAILSPPAITPERLQEVAGRYLRPGAWIVVKVGPPGP